MATNNPKAALGPRTRVSQQAAILYLRPRHEWLDRAVVDGGVARPGQFDNLLCDYVIFRNQPLAICNGVCEIRILIFPERTFPGMWA